MDVPHYRALAEFFTRFTTAINEAKTEDDFDAASALFKDPLFTQLEVGVQDELIDHFDHRYERRATA